LNDFDKKYNFAPLLNLLTNYIIFMKKLLLFVLIGGALIAFTSCKKTCTCTDNILGVSIEYTIKSGAYEAVKNCKELEKLLNGGGVVDVYKCK
jgi:hypothetical protein